MSNAKFPPYFADKGGSCEAMNVSSPGNPARRDSRSELPAIILPVPLAYSAPRPRRRYLLLFILVGCIFWATIMSPRIIIQSWQTSAILVKDSALMNWASQTSPTTLDLKNWLRPTLKEKLSQPEHDEIPHLDCHNAKVDLVSEDTTSTTSPLKASTQTDSGTLFDDPNALPMQNRIRPKKRPTSTFTKLPSFRPRPDMTYENVRPFPHQLTDDEASSEDSRFLSYLPHSGFHNQRIELQNAFRLSRLLNRTLILPQLRLGRALAWSASEELVKAYEREIKSLHLDCVGQDLPSGYQPSTPEDCHNYSDWTSVQADYLLNIQALVKEQPVMDQLDVRESWFWEALHLNEGDWYSVEDNKRYSYQIFESSSTSERMDDKYEYRLDIDDLKRFEHVKLMSFGSLFGSNRLITRSEESKLWNKKLMTSQLPNVPIIQSISEQIADQLGGRGTYVGLHLRVGDLYFRRQAPESMPKIFERLCSEVFHLKKIQIRQLIERHEQVLASKSHVKHQTRSFLVSDDDAQDTDHQIVDPKLYQSWNQHEDEEHLPDNSLDVNKLLKEKISLEVPLSLPQGAQQLHTKRSLTHSSRRTGSLENLKCRGPLYTDPELEHLNVPIYVATDVSRPMDHVHLSIFFETFPCVFTLSDFMAGNFSRNIRNLDHLRSGSDGLKLRHFLDPMLEAIVAAKGSATLGTPGSTFSSYAVSLLHAHYSKEVPSTPRRVT